MKYGPQERVTDPKPGKPKVQVVSQGRIMAIKGPKSAVAKGGLSARRTAAIVNGLGD